MAGGSSSWCLKKVGGSAQKYGVIPLKDGEEVSVGRGTDVTIQLLAVKNFLILSRKHAIFRQVDDGSWTVIDNKSLNGVQVNGSKIPPLVPTALKDGDKLELGKKPNDNEQNEFIYTVKKVEQSAEDVDKLLKAWKRRAEKIQRKILADAAKPGGRENSARTDSQAAAGSNCSCSAPCERKRKEMDDGGAPATSSAIGNNPNEPSTSSSVKRSRLSCDGDAGDQIVSGARRKLMEQFGSKISAEEMVELTEFLTCTKGESILQKLKSTVKKQEEAAEENARREEAYKSKVEEKEEELRRKEEELSRHRRLQEEAVEMQRRLLREKEEALARMRQEMQDVLETQVKEKETALMEQLRQQREELLNEKEKVESTLQEEFSKQLAEKDRSLKVEQEGMRTRLEEAIQEKEAQMLAQLEAEKQAMIEEKQKVEEKLHTALEKDKGLEEEKHRLDEIIQQKEKEKTDMEQEMEASRLKREQEEQVKIAMAKQSALEDFTDVMENELQCSICSELFIQATTLNCSHSYCSYCINMWLKRKKECPVCRAKTTSHSRSIVLDNYIDKMIEKLGDEAKQRRKEILEERKEQDPGKSDGGQKVAAAADPVVVSSDIDDDDDDEDEDEDEEEEEDGYWDYDRYGRYRRHHYHDSDEERSEDSDENAYMY